MKEKKISRRQFLKSTGAIAAGTAVSASLIGSLSGCATTPGGAAPGAAGFGGWVAQNPSPLFESVNIGSLTLKNRMIRSAAAEGRGIGGNPTPDLINMYSRSAEGGAGMLITGLTPVLNEEQFFATSTTFGDDSQIPIYRQLTDAVHRNGSKICIQLTLIGTSRAWDVANPNKRIFAPVPMTDRNGTVATRGMTVAEIRECIDAYARAGIRAQEAGFDAIEFHFCHHFLISKWFTPYFNYRTDEWGGPEIANRARFAFEIVEAVRRVVGREFPLIAKIDGNDFLGRGNTQDDISFIAQGLVDRGIDALEISGGSDGDVRYRNIVSDILFEEDQMYFSRNARNIARNVNIPLLLTGGVRDVVMMERALRQNPNIAAFTMARTMIIEPDLPNKWQRDPGHTPRCVSCNWCIDNLFRLGHLDCPFGRGGA